MEKMALRRMVTVTEKKLAANRRNAKQPTGPRTERGKNNSMFNAVTTGLFAKNVVIPLHDCGDDPEDCDPNRQFSRLLEALQQEYQPEGPSEGFWVAQIAECMWKQRRASRSDKNSVETRDRQRRKSAGSRRALIHRTLDAILILTKAQAEIPATQTLSPAPHYTLGRMERKNDTTPSVRTLEDDFIPSLQKARLRLESMVGGGLGMRRGQRSLLQTFSPQNLIWTISCLTRED